MIVTVVAWFFLGGIEIILLGVSVGIVTGSSAAYFIWKVTED